MAILNKEEARRILEKVVKLCEADHCSVTLGGSDQGNIRYARNTVSTSGMESNISLGVNVAFGKKTGTATTNELTDAALERTVRRAEELARLAPENPEYMEPLEPQEYEEGRTFAQSTADITPEFRAEMTAKSIEKARAKGLIAAGFIEDGHSFNALMNSKGLFAYNRSSEVDFTLTVRNEDGTGSGWVSREVNDVDKIDIEAASAIAVEKAARSVGAKAIEPGKYTVILEPEAAANLLQLMFFNMGARQADEGRSFLAKQGGGTKLGEKIVDERVNVYSDPLHPEAPTNTWSGDGLPIKKTSWLENGVVKNLIYDRYWASQNDRDPVPFPGGAVMVGGDASLEEMIRNTRRGILVTRFWYIRSVDPQTLLYTGLTRDGTFFIEDGQIRYPIKNMRFNESPVIMLNNLETLGVPQRVGNSMIPPIKVRDFTFTSLSDAI